MNILFYTSFEVSPTKGGTERITATIATALQRIYQVKCYSIYKTSISSNFERTHFVESQQIMTDKSFEDNLYNFIDRNDIDILVNQGAFELALPMKRVLDRFQGKHLITVHHFNPGAEEHFLNLHHVLWELKNKEHIMKNTVKLLTYPILKWHKHNKITKSYHDAYISSDRIVLLSGKFYNEFSSYARLEDTNKLRYIHNALSFNSFFRIEDYAQKQKEVLIVSRLDEIQKRISLALDIWKKVKQNPLLRDWKLTIVGYGDEYENTYKRKVKMENIPQVYFEGAQHPEPYYKRASLFLLTSSFEGWGLTLTEAQQFGVVPLAFNSYASLTDIITDGENGFVIPEGDVERYVERLMTLMIDDSMRKRIAEEAIESSKRFKIEKIVAEWMSLFEELMN